MSVLDPYLEKFLKEGIELDHADIKEMLIAPRMLTDVRSAVSSPDVERSKAVAIRIEEEVAANIAKLIPESRMVTERDVFSMIDLAKREPDSTPNREASNNAIFNLLQAISNGVLKKLKEVMPQDDQSALNVEIDLESDINQLSPGGPTPLFSEEHLAASHIQNILMKHFGLEE